MNKKVLRILVISLIVLVVIGTTIFFVVKKFNNEPDVSDSTNPPLYIEVTGKLLNYINKIGDSYYIKYSGGFKDNLGEYKEAIVEVTTQGEKFAVRSSQLEMFVVYDGEKINSVSDRYNLTIQMVRSAFNLNDYHLAKDIGQLYAKSYTEELNGILYDVEEYKYYQDTLKYYFKEDDLKVIKHNDRMLKVLRMEKNTNSEMFKIPEEYKVVIM